MAFLVFFKKIFSKIKNFFKFLKKCIYFKQVNVSSEALVLIKTKKYNEINYTVRVKKYSPTMEMIEIVEICKRLLPLKIFFQYYFIKLI